jgi:integrase
MARRGRYEGSLFQRPNGSWRAQVSKSGSRLSYDGKARSECQEWLRLQNKDTPIDPHHVICRLTVQEYMEEWLQTAKSSLRPKIGQQYEQLARNYIFPNLGRLFLTDLKLTQVENLYQDLSVKGKHPRTVRYVHSVLHRALERAVRQELIVRNPAHGATLPRRTQKEMKILDESQICRFLVAAHDTKYEAIYHLAITTGMRQGELLGLSWADIDWASGRLSVRRQLQRITGSGFELSEPKTSAGRRTIQLGQGTLNALRRHQEKQQFLKAVAGDRWQEQDLIFTSSVGTPLDQSNLMKEYIKILSDAGLPRIRFHDLRHTAASLMINHGIPINLVSRILGHSKPSVTLDIYSHVYSGQQEEVARLMDELVVPIEVELQKPELVIRENMPKDLHHLHLNFGENAISPERTGPINGAEPLEMVPLEGFEPPTY